MFGTAANNGQMIAEISASHRTTKMFLQIAQPADGPRRDQKAAGFVPVADHQEVAGGKAESCVRRSVPTAAMPVAAINQAARWPSPASFRVCTCSAFRDNNRFR